MERCNRCQKDVFTTELKNMILGTKKIYCDSCGDIIRVVKLSDDSPLKAPASDTEYY
jgi:hypothetical protein